MEEIKESEVFKKIKDTRRKKDGSEIKDSSIISYIKTLNTIKKKLDATDDEIFTLEETLDKILNMDIHYTTKRNYYNAIIVYLFAMDLAPDLIEKYVKVRDEANEKYQDMQAQDYISKKQEPNFVPREKIIEMVNEMGKKIKSVKWSITYTSQDYSLLQRYVMLNIYIRLPLRNDVAGMIAINKRQYNKLTIKDKMATNYLVNSSKGPMFMVLNDYKTSAKYKEKILEIPQDLSKLLKNYIKINKYGYLFKSNRGNPYTRNQISQLFLKTSQEYLDGKNISTTLLRKIYLSDKYADVKEEMKKDAEVMGHSVATQQSVYVKKVPEV